MTGLRSIEITRRYNLAVFDQNLPNDTKGHGSYRTDYYEQLHVTRLTAIELAGEVGVDIKFLDQKRLYTRRRNTVSYTVVSPDLNVAMYPVPFEYRISPIWDKAEEMDIRPYEHLETAPAMKAFREFFIAEGKKGFPPERIAAVIHEALTAAKPKVRYPVVPGHFQNWTMPRLLPARVVDKVLAGRFGLIRKND